MFPLLLTLFNIHIYQIHHTCCRWQYCALNNLFRTNLQHFTDRSTYYNMDYRSSNAFVRRVITILALLSFIQWLPGVVTYPRTPRTPTKGHNWSHNTFHSWQIHRILDHIITKGDNVLFLLPCVYSLLHFKQ